MLLYCSSLLSPQSSVLDCERVLEGKEEDFPSLQLISAMKEIRQKRQRKNQVLRKENRRKVDSRHIYIAKTFSSVE